MEILAKIEIVAEKLKCYQKDQIFGEKLEFDHWKFRRNIEILVKAYNFPQRWKFSKNLSDESKPKSAVGF